MSCILLSSKHTRPVKKLITDNDEYVETCKIMATYDINSFASNCGKLYANFKNYYTVAHKDTIFNNLRWDKLSIAQRVHLILLFLISETDFKISKNSEIQPCK